MTIQQIQALFSLTFKYNIMWPIWVSRNGVPNSLPPILQIDHLASSNVWSILINQTQTQTPWLLLLFFFNSAIFVFTLHDDIVVHYILT